MRTELPADRLHRRLSGDTADTADTAGVAEDSGDDPKALVPRWLPDAEPGQGPLRQWLASARADPGRAGAVALAVVAALAVLVTVFTLIRDQPAPVASAKLPPVQMASGQTSGTATATGPPPTTSRVEAPGAPLVVSVVGLVGAPGLVTVTPGARVADAISAAGGTLGGADTIGLNMARHVADGEQVVVGMAPAPGRPPALGSSISAAGGPQSPGAARTSTAPKGPVDLNTATVEQLDELPGIGPVTAQAIVSWREQNGSFVSVDQLGEVDGIGPARLEKLRDLVRV